MVVNWEALEEEEVAAAQTLKEVAKGREVQRRAQESVQARPLNATMKLGRIGSTKKIKEVQTTITKYKNLLRENRALHVDFVPLLEIAQAACDKLKDQHLASVFSKHRKKHAGYSITLSKNGEILAEDSRRQFLT